MASRKGCVPKGIAEKSERLKQGLIARRKLLELAIKENWSVVEAHEAGIPTNSAQREITDWHDPGRGIYRLSLNTAKKHASIFSEVISLLKFLQENILSEPRPRKKRASQSADRIRALEENIKNKAQTISALTSSLVEIRSLTLMLLRELEDESRLTPFQRARLHDIRKALQVELKAPNGTGHDS